MKSLWYPQGKKDKNITVYLHHKTSKHKRQRDKKQRTTDPTSVKYPKTINKIVIVNP